MYQIIQYIKFLFRSTNQHGVHSPFVYDLITKCFYDKNNHIEYEDITKYRQHLLRNDAVLKVKDLGSGSKKTKRKERQICEIAKTSGTTPKRARLLFRLSRYFKFNNILELGTSLGISSHALHLGNSNSKIITIEGAPEISIFSKMRLSKFHKIKVETGSFDYQIPQLKNNKYDLIFFDGNHQKEATLNYFETLLQTTHNNSVFIFDDIYWSKGMTDAWEIINQHPKVTVTIDTFYWGFVFFRKEQLKEHFTIRV